WFLCLYLLAGVAVAEIASALGTLLARDPQRPTPVPDLVAPVVALATVLVIVGLPLKVLPGWVPFTTTDSSFIPSWVKWNYSGYEGKPAYPEYHRVVQTMSKLPCGR